MNPGMSQNIGEWSEQCNKRYTTMQSGNGCTGAPDLRTFSVCHRTQEALKHTYMKCF